MAPERDIRVQPNDSTVKERNPNDLKFGIRAESPIADKSGELVNLTPDQPLSDAVAHVTNLWGLTDPSIYALRFNEPPYHYVTEKSRKDINGKIVQLYYSPEYVSKELATKLKNEQGLKELSVKTSDCTLVDVFISVGGFDALLHLIEKGLNDREMFYALKAFLDLMALGSKASWEVIRPSLFSRVISYVNSASTKITERLAIEPALQVLDTAVTEGTAYAQVDKDVNITVLLSCLSQGDSKIQQNSLGLINALLGKADLKKKNEMKNKLGSNFRQIILTQIIEKSNEKTSGMNQELYTLQTLFLDLLDERKSKSAQNFEESKIRLQELVRLAFDGDYFALSENSASTLDLVGNTSSLRRDKSRHHTRDHKKLGFNNLENPLMDFDQCPPGTLALDCMYYLATHHKDTYTKLVLESACRSAGSECPFARASIALVAILCDLLKIGEPPVDQGGHFYPLFFRHEDPFPELYCICAQLVIKTWKEMRATTEDFDKVMDVVREQIRCALEPIPDTFPAFRSNLEKFKYDEIQKKRLQERSLREEGELKAKPIQELRKNLEPEIIELIKANRINYLKAGTRFNTYSNKGLVTMQRMKDKFKKCQLSSNGKTLTYCDCDDKGVETSNPKVMAVADITELLTGKDCPNMKDNKSKKGNVALAFSVMAVKESQDVFNLIAPDEKTFDLWTDGINALIGKPMTSKEAVKDLKILLNMEIKLRLLNLEGISEIPQEPPEIPPLPKNYEFSLRSH